MVFVFFKPSMLNYHDHYYYLVVLISADACLAEWYPGLRQMPDFAV